VNKRPTDREVYPAVWIAAAILLVFYLFWRYILGAPALPACWFASRWHIYCPACGGTRALIALSRGRLISSLVYHPAVLYVFGSAALYVLSQSIWRMRGRRGWVLHYRSGWLVSVLILLLGNWLIRNILWLCFQIPIPQ